MSDRQITKETAATGAAFRAGVRGLRYTEHPDPAFDMAVVTNKAQGPNERHFETMERLPGLSDPVAAYEAGRALRMIGHSMDMLAAILHETCAIKAKPLISFTTMRMGCLMKFFAMKSLAQVFGGLGRFRAVR